MMSFSRKKRGIASFGSLAMLVAVSVLLAGCGNSNLQQSEEQIKPERNLLTGLVGTNGRVLAVKFDDTRAAHPQEGVENADVVFVTQVEAGLTRIMGIYSSNYPDQVGPVRSARISDIDILAQFGRVGFLYSGAQSKLRPVLAAANLVNLSAERNPPSIYFTDPERTPPYAMMVRIPLLLEKASDVDTVKSVGWQHGPKAEGAVDIDSVEINWPNARYDAIWNPLDSKFDLSFNGVEDFAKSGVRLGANMLVIQIIEIEPSEYGDRFGGITPKNKVIGSGKAYLLRGGTVTEVFWTRESATAPTLWYLPSAEGEPIPAYFARGQVWFFLTDKEPKFTYSKNEPQN